MKGSDILKGLDIKLRTALVRVGPSHHTTDYKHPRLTNPYNKRVDPYNRRVATNRTRNTLLPKRMRGEVRVKQTQALP